MTKFDAIVIGSGQGGNPLAEKLADQGWTVALIEQGHVGGTCINTDGVPLGQGSPRDAVLRRPVRATGVAGSVSGTDDVSANRARTGPAKKLPRSFFRQPAEELAPALIGKILVRRIRSKTFQARIVETEAYLGPDDLASHASKGRTLRTEVLFGPAGRAYVYLIYGMYDMLNVVAGEEGEAQAVLIRAARPLNGWKADHCLPDLSGPAG